MDLDNFSDICTEVQDEIDNGSTTNQTRIKKFINKIYRKCISKIIQVNQDYFLTRDTSSVVTVADQKTYTWSSDFSITDLMKPVGLTDENDIPLTKGNLRFDQEDYFWIGNTGIGFNPTPGSATTSQ